MFQFMLALMTYDLGLDNYELHPILDEFFSINFSLRSECALYIVINAYLFHDLCFVYYVVEAKITLSSKH